MPGLFGLSVQHQPGKTLQELAAAGRFPNAQISVVLIESLIAAARRVGYHVAAIPSPATGYHATLMMPNPVPPVLGQALSEVFVRMPNPAPVAT